MKVTLRLFAMLREQAGWRARELELDGQPTVADAWQQVVAQAPQLGRYEEVVRFARNGAYVPVDVPLGDGDEVAVIPPVAGGGDAGTDAPPDRLLRCELTEQPIADELLGELRRTVPTAADGALVLFVGQVRETPGPPAPGEEENAMRHAGEPVTGLEYEAFGEMAVAVLREMGAEIEQAFGVRRLAIVHRVGPVGLSEPTVVIAAAAPHRAAAFDACRYAIEQLKARAPIWKQERYESGAVWVATSEANDA